MSKRKMVARGKEAGSREAKKEKVVWYARGGGVSMSGPYETQMEAVKAMLLTGCTLEHPLFPADVFIWPVEQ